MKSFLSRFSSSLFAVAVATVVVTGGGTLAGIASGTVPAALAQDQGSAPAPAPGQGRARGRMGKILMSLDLSDAQKTQIRAIIADARSQNKTVTDRDQKRANMKAAYAKVEIVLTPAQRTQLHAKMEAMRADSAAHPQ